MANINNKAFDNMITSAKADKSKVTNLFGEKKRIDIDDVHNSLMVAGMTPVIGNVADAADALLYALDGEFGNAAISAAAMIPYVGQTVSAKKALKATKETGEKMIKLYRGIDKWYPGQMVKNRVFISPRAGSNFEAIKKQFGTDKAIWATRAKDKADWYSGAKLGNTDALVLEFEVPESWYRNQQSLLRKPKQGVLPLIT